MWLIPSLAANAAAMLLEWAYRARWFQTYIAGWWLFLPMAVAIQAGLYHSYSAAPKLLVAWGAFFAVNAVLRLLLSTVVLHEAFTPWTAIGLALIAVGAILVRW